MLTNLCHQFWIIILPRGGFVTFCHGVDWRWKVQTVEMDVVVVLFIWHRLVVAENLNTFYTLGGGKCWIHKSENVLWPSISWWRAITLWPLHVFLLKTRGHLLKRIIIRKCFVIWWPINSDHFLSIFPTPHPQLFGMEHRKHLECEWNWSSCEKIAQNAYTQPVSCAVMVRVRQVVRWSGGHSVVLFCANWIQFSFLEKVMPVGFDWRKDFVPSTGHTQREPQQS